MKTINCSYSPNKISNFILQFLCLVMLPIILLNCKKLDDPQLRPENKQAVKSTSNNNPSNLNGRVSTIEVGNVMEWLEAQRDENNPAKNEIVLKLLENVIPEELYTESLNEEENLVIVPLKNDYFSQHVVSGSSPLQYLQLVEDANGEIRRGEIVLFYPTDLELFSLPENSFHDFYTSESFPVDGTFTLINLEDHKYYEMDFVEGKKSEFRQWERRLASPMENEQTCLDWYYVLTTYNLEDGSIIDQTITFLYTTCTSNSGGSGGGGAPINNDEGVETTRRVSFVVKAQANKYCIRAEYLLTGMRYNDPNRNIITGITALEIPEHNIGPAGHPNDPWHSTWSLTSNVTSFTQLVASAIVHGTLTFPNQSLPNQSLISNWGNWHAATDL